MNGYIYGALGIVLAVLAGIVVYRGYEVDNLKDTLRTAQIQVATANQNVSALESLRTKDNATQQEALQNAAAILKSPAKDNGPVSPVLRRVLNGM